MAQQTRELSKDMTVDDAVRMAEDAGVQLVFFIYCDNGGTSRGKAAQIKDLRRRMNGGINLTVGMQAVGEGDSIVEVSGMGPVGEVRMVPDPNTFTVLPWAPKRAMMMVDLVRLDHKPWEACPRDFLKRMNARAAERGLSLKASFEGEWYLAKKEGDKFIPADESSAFSGIGMTAVQPVIDDIVDAMMQEGLQVELYLPESGDGQHEIAIRYADALRAADNQMMYRETVRNVAWQHGYYASFAPKPFPEQAGSGAHLHFSVWDLEGENNLFYESDVPYALSETGWMFLGGVLEHLPALAALTCPSFNSYRRLVPGAWAAAYVTYGPDNRDSAVRIPSAMWGHERTSVNMELKVSDASANPYISIGGLIAAGIDGIERGLRPKPQHLLDHNRRMSPEEIRERGHQRLPTNLGEAIEALETDQVLLDALGPSLAESYLAVRRGEWELFSARDEAFEVKRHFYKY